MNFQPSAKTRKWVERLIAFVENNVWPVEAEMLEFVDAPENHWKEPPMLAPLKEKARAEGLWNLFLPPEYGDFSPGLTNLEYAPLAEIMGRSEILPEIFNCSAPDTGNMEVLARYGTAEQQDRWLRPLMNGDIRSSFLMTEPAVASSDATNIECSIERDGDEYVINGHKWWASGVLHPRNEILIVMGKTDPGAERHRQQSMVLVPTRTPGVEIVRPLEVFGSVHSPGGHGEVILRDVRVPRDHLILGEGRGFEIAQGRLGPGRVHHCMRLIGAAQYALEVTSRRVDSREAFGRKLSEQGSVRADIARSRCEIEQARLLTLAAADRIDHDGPKGAMDLISMIKIVVPSMCQRVVDRAIQMHGALGMSNDVPLSRLFSYARLVRIADGPDEVHLAQLGKRTIKRYL
ncbi:MAG: acyl-CoA dehydrogenase family protein [Xanthomonadales bacterium]|nr:acyl-CoA dehydrogenase family protein [Xanthomonadales bacterium]